MQAVRACCAVRAARLQPAAPQFQAGPPPAGSHAVCSPPPPTGDHCQRGVGEHAAAIALDQAARGGLVLLGPHRSQGEVAAGQGACEGGAASGWQLTVSVLLAWAPPPQPSGAAQRHPPTRRPPAHPPEGAAMDCVRPRPPSSSALARLAQLAVGRSAARAAASAFSSAGGLRLRCSRGRQEGRRFRQPVWQPRGRWQRCMQCRLTRRF